MLHHILDPRTGLPAEPVWRTVSVAAGTCADANAASTAAVIRGRRALGWLAQLGLPARLVDATGVVFTVAGWPAEPNPAEPNPAEPNPAEPNPAEPNPAEPNPAEPNPAEPNPAERNPAERNPAERNPAERNPAERNPAELDDEPHYHEQSEAVQK